MQSIMHGVTYGGLANGGFLDNSSVFSAMVYGFTSHIITERLGNDLAANLAGIIAGAVASKTLDPERPMTFKAIQKGMAIEGAYILIYCVVLATVKVYADS